MNGVIAFQPRGWRHLPKSILQEMLDMNVMRPAAVFSLRLTRGSGSEFLRKQERSDTREREMAHRFVCQLVTVVTLASIPTRDMPAHV